MCGSPPPGEESREREQEVALGGRGDVSGLAQRWLPEEEEGKRAEEGKSAALRESVRRGQRESQRGV